MLTDFRRAVLQAVGRVSRWWAVNRRRGPNEKSICFFSWLCCCQTSTMRVRVNYNAIKSSATPLCRYVLAGLMLVKNHVLSFWATTTDTNLARAVCRRWNRAPCARGEPITAPSGMWLTWEIRTRPITSPNGQVKVHFRHVRSGTLGHKVRETVSSLDPPKWHHGFRAPRAWRRPAMFTSATSQPSEHVVCVDSGCGWGCRLAARLRERCTGIQSLGIFAQGAGVQLTLNAKASETTMLKVQNIILAWDLSGK